jgi:serine/threonine protein kinase
VNFIGACINPPGLFIVMELMEGGTLFDLLHKSGTELLNSRKLQIAEEIAIGLQFLHNNRVCYCFPST